jgi:hypothetical protein
MVRHVRSVEVLVIGLSQIYYMNLSAMRKNVRDVAMKKDVPGFGVNRPVSPGIMKSITMNIDTGNTQGHPVDPRTSTHGGAAGAAPPRSARHRQYFRVGIGGAP